MVIRPLTSFDRTRFCEIACGYVSSQRYAIRKEETDACTTFTITLEDLAAPYVKNWLEDVPDYAMYDNVIREHGLSLGAYENDLLIGLAIAERRDWNRCLWVWEFHVHEAYRRQGIGRQLIEGLNDTARHAGLHTLFCETQNTNVAAIRFYRALVLS